MQRSQWKIFPAYPTRSVLLDGKERRTLLTALLVAGGLLAVANERVQTWIVGSLMGLPAAPPLAVPDAKVRHFLQDAPTNRRLARRIGEQTIEADAEDGNTTSARLRLFDEKPRDFGLPREWQLVSSDPRITKEQVDANTCITSSGIGGQSVRCLPSFVITGFEKCGTTNLNIWLSYHPNLNANWLEARFFDKVKKDTELEDRWPSYLRTLPRVPGGEHGVGKYWTYEKTPSYATSENAPAMMASLLPNARMIVAIRNPVDRAYSNFLMYTHHYLGVPNALRGRPVSFFAKNEATGDVQYITHPGIGGGLVPEKDVPISRLGKAGGWYYLNYPPDPADFDSWIRGAIDKSDGKPNPRDTSRAHRIIFEGFYATYLKQWLPHYSSDRIMVIPSEIFWSNGDVLGSFDKLQEALGVPHFNYSEIVKRNLPDGRIELNSPATFLNTVINGNGNAHPMLNRTRQLLDDFYCESNRELSQMIGGRILPGYSCTGDGTDPLSK